MGASSSFLKFFFLFLQEHQLSHTAVLSPPPLIFRDWFPSRRAIKTTWYGATNAMHAPPDPNSFCGQFLQKNNVHFISKEHSKRDCTGKKIKNNEVIIAGLDAQKQFPLGSACLIVSIIYGFIMNKKQFTVELFSGRPFYASYTLLTVYSHF